MHDPYCTNFTPNYAVLVVNVSADMALGFPSVKKITYNSLTIVKNPPFKTFDEQSCICS